MHTDLTNKQPQKKEFTIDSQNINQEICIQVTFTKEIKLKKYIFTQNMNIFLTANVPFWNPC